MHFKILLTLISYLWIENWANKLNDTLPLALDKPWRAETSSDPTFQPKPNTVVKFYRFLKETEKVRII